LERKLTAILCADVHGYSRFMGEDEEATLRTLSAYRKIIDQLIENHRGRFVNSAGDSVLAEFLSVVEAVNCALEIQNALKPENTGLGPVSSGEPPPRPPTDGSAPRRRIGGRAWHQVLGSRAKPWLIFVVALELLQENRLHRGLERQLAMLANKLSGAAQ